MWFASLRGLNLIRKGEGEGRAKASESVKFEHTIFGIYLKFYFYFNFGQHCRHKAIRWIFEPVIKNWESTLCILTFNTNIITIQNFVKPACTTLQKLFEKDVETTLYLTKPGKQVTLMSNDFFFWSYGYKYGIGSHQVRPLNLQTWDWRSPRRAVSTNMGLAVAPGRAVLQQLEYIDISTFLD